MSALAQAQRLIQTRAELRGHPWWSLAAVALGVFMVGIDGSVVAIANPAIALHLHASLQQLQWITNAYLLALAALLVLGGKLGDRYGRRLVFLIGVAGFGVVSVGIGLIGNTEGVIALRALQGVFGAMLMPNTLAILRSAFPPHKLNAAIGIWGGASAVSIALGPIVGGLLVEHISWESVFYINAPIAALALIVGAVVIKESRGDVGRHHRLDIGGTLTLSGALFLIVFGLVKAQDWGWTSTTTLAAIMGGIALLAVFVGIERRTAHPLLPMHLFANLSLTIGTIVVVINTFALMGVMFFVTLYLQSVHGLSPVSAGAHTLPLSAAVIIAAPLSGLLTARFGPRLPMLMGMSSVVVGLILLLRLQADSAYTVLWPAFILFGGGVGLVMTASSEVIVGNASVDDAGIAGGLQSTALQLGGVIGTAVLGSVLANRVGAVLNGKLLAAGTPPPLAAMLRGTSQYVAQGVAPVAPGMPASVRAAVVTGSHDAFIAGLHTALVVAVVVAVVGVALTLCVRRGENAGAGGMALH